jgi:hypothetical protein
VCGTVKHGPNYDTAPDASFWTGTGAADIIQTGCDSISAKTATYKCWTEDYRQDTIWEGPAVSPGQEVYAYDGYLNNETTQFIIENVTTGSTSSFVNKTPYVGLGTGEFIQEELGKYLPDSGTVKTLGNSYTNQQGDQYPLANSSETKNSS